jgi:hypothetical protein
VDDYFVHFLIHSFIHNCIPFPLIVGNVDFHLRLMLCVTCMHRPC